MVGFKKASRTAKRLRIGLESPSGGGKTYTSLVIATELAEHDGGQVGLIDSERGSAAMYAGGRPFEFDIAELESKEPTAYVEMLIAASHAHYPVVVIDSASHEWKGVLGMVDRAAERMQGNTWAGWSKGRPAHDAFVDALLAMPSHVIATFRSKQETRQVRRDGKTVVESLGLAAVTDDSMTYEFDVWGSIDHETHAVIVTKSRIDTIPIGSEWPLGHGLADAYLAWVDGAEYEAPTQSVAEAARGPQRAPEPSGGGTGQPRGQQRPQNARTAPQRTAEHLIAWAEREHGLSRPQVLSMLQVSSAEAITDLVAAHRTIIEKLGVPPRADVEETHDDREGTAPDDEGAGAGERDGVSGQ